MNEVYEFCRRVLGGGTTAIEATHEAFACGATERLEVLAAASRACRARARSGDREPAIEREQSPLLTPLASAVAQELAAASSRLAEPERESLALRELLALSHEQIAQVMALDLDAVAPLLAQSRLALHEERRRTATRLDHTCADHGRALRILARRQDSESRTAADDEWLLEHLAVCRHCKQAHAAMLEASVCYRAWPVVDRSQESATVPATSPARAPDDSPS